jgi:hypothetical protein
MDPLPAVLPGTVARILATTDLAAVLVPFLTSYGEGGSCAGVVELLAAERERQPTVWVDAGDFTVGPAYPLLGTRPWADMGDPPIDAAAAEQGTATGRRLGRTGGAARPGAPLQGGAVGGGDPA